MWQRAFFSIFPMFFLVGLSLCSSCAYQMGFEQRQFPSGYKNVSIPIFKNRTQHVGVESYFTNAIVNEFHRSQLVKVVPRSVAPVVIKGFIESVEFGSSAITEGPVTSLSSRTAPFLPPNTILTTEYRVQVRVKIFLRRVSDQKVIWQGDFNHEKTYSAPQVGLEIINTVNPLYNHSAKNINLQKIAKEMMSEAHDRMTENF